MEPSLEQRLTRVERENRILRCAMLALAAGVLGFASCRPELGTKTVVAQSFVLKDASGQVRGEWLPSEELLPSDGGAERTASVTCLRLRTSEGKLALQICGTWDAEAATGIFLAHPGGARVTMSADAEGSSLRMGSQRTEERPRVPRVSLGADADSASLFVGTGGPRGTILTMDELIMRDERGHVFARIPDPPNGRQ